MLGIDDVFKLIILVKRFVVVSVVDFIWVWVFEGLSFLKDFGYYVCNKIKFE